ncbi:hypothetical protein DFJ73DRAFT_962441 [Zopfochytrium polystomum]|nr:hypothetical protein DFJ73DRAFT_962441 [Zopfochytrium polystomum]
MSSTWASLPSASASTPLGLWLTQNGGVASDLISFGRAGAASAKGKGKAADIPAAADIDKGYGLFACRDAKDLVEDQIVAAMPRSLLLNAACVIDFANNSEAATGGGEGGEGDELSEGRPVQPSPQSCLAACLNGLMADEDCGIDERRALLVFLLWARFCVPPGQAADGLGPNHPLFWKPYVDALPQSLETPVFFDPESDAMQLLMGTGVDDSTNAKLKKLHREYRQMLPHLRSLVEDEEVDYAEELTDLSFERFKWADGIFWSRIMSFHSTGSTEEEGAPDYHLVPFVDFANHALDPKLRWHLGDDGSVQLRVTKLGAESGFLAGEELSISYGEKPNSEFMFIHGMTLPDNPHDCVSFRAPLIEYAIDEGSEASIEAKTLLMRFLGLRPMVDVRSPLDKSGTPLRSDDMLVLLISVAMEHDGLVPEIAGDDEHFFVVNGEVVMDKDELWRVYNEASCPDLYQRAYYILSDLLRSRLHELAYAAELEEHPPKSQKEYFLFVLREGHRSILEGAMEFLTTKMQTRK